jgi:hypothetical protein
VAQKSIIEQVDENLNVREIAEGSTKSSCCDCVGSFVRLLIRPELNTEVVRLNPKLVKNTAVETKNSTEELAH